jgi:hypothetical protein
MKLIIVLDMIVEVEGFRMDSTVMNELHADMPQLWGDNHTHFYATSIVEVLNTGVPKYLHM